MKELNVFDFDETLFRVPNFCSKTYLEKKIPTLYFEKPYDFFDNSASLDLELFNIFAIKPSFEKFKESLSSDDSNTIIITHRTQNLKKDIISILKKFGIINFNNIYTLGRKKSKVEILEKIIKENSSILKVNIWEDSIQQLNEYSKFNFIEKNIEVSYYFVDKSRIFKVESFNFIEEEKIQLL
jgi:hypothetical protein